MRPWRALLLLVLVALIGAAGTFVAGAAAGMGEGELLHLAAYVVPAFLVTVSAMWVAGRLLARASVAQRFVAVGAIGVVVALSNLWVLSRQMFVSEHDATLLGVLLLYSVGAGIGVAVVMARSQSRALGRLTTTADALGEGDLDARVGPIDGGPELELLASTLDDMAERLSLAHERERAAESTRRDLITAVSHDLRTPIASLRAMVEAIDDRVVEDPASMRRYASEMRRSIRQVVAMVDDLFELAQLDAVAIETEAHRARLGEVVGTAVAAVELQAEEKGLSLVAELNGAEDAPCSPRLVRVIQNLLVNAVRHTPADGSVRVEARRTASSIEIAVADTGEGIAPEDLTRVFEPFFRADPARHGAGAGLGLALAKRIVDTLGGEISAQSEPSRGARFAVTLPA
ncbi:MAG TPA: HAMP domain-containing sensor histidine kinase [Actinomycetota bacterium]|jgi:signal transduction histidine kinase